MDDANKEIIKDFLTEAFSGLDQLDQDFVTLESAPEDAELIGRIFRNIHSVKGASGFFAFHQLEALAHAGENLLGMARDKVIVLSQHHITVLLKMVDGIRELLTHIDQHGNEGQLNFSQITAEVAALVQGHKQDSAPAEKAQEGGAEAAHGDAAGIKSGGGSAADASVRIAVDQLDRLMNLVGELVLVRNQICEPDQSDPTALQRLNLITSELQENVMKTRMQAIDSILNKYPRVIRDLALTCGKKVKLEMLGRDTELDRSVIEAMKDPLTHLMRNAVDHGIEPPDGRLKAGKPEEGLLRVKAYHEGGLVNIEISDDGRGLDPEKLKRKAVEKRLISEDKAAQLTDREAVNLIFLAGFSTAEQVTNVSGRGVGMDVVKSNIEKIGGTIDIETRLGHGSLFKLKIPLTLAIIPALIVHAAKTRYAIPMSSLVELVRVEKGGLGVEFIHGAPVYRLRDQLIPLLFLDRELGGVSKDAPYGPVANIVVLQAGDRLFGLAVDRIHDTQEVVVKPLGRQLKGSPVFSGATILGDGKVSLIIDVLNFAKRAHVVSDVAEQNRHASGAAGADAGDGKLQMLVLVESPDDGRLVIPFVNVSRLEKVPCASLEKIGKRTVVQYRGGIMPLMWLSDLLIERRKNLRDDRDMKAAERESLDVVVFATEQGNVGLIVDRILDIIEDSVNRISPPSRPGIVGCIVHREKVTEILDVKYTVNLAFAGEA